MRSTRSVNCAKAPRELVVALEAEGDQPKLGLVRDVVGHDLEHHRIAELAGRGLRLGQRGDPTLRA